MEDICMYNETGTQRGRHPMISTKEREVYLEIIPQKIRPEQSMRC